MKNNSEDLAEMVSEDFDLNRKTIGIDIGLDKIISLAFQKLAEEELPALQEELERYEGKKFKTFGKIEMLEEMQNL